MEYYDGAPLLSQKDINGNLPELFICSGNRSSGKTTYFLRLLFNSFVKRKRKFIYLVRNKYDLDGVDDRIFKDIEKLFFPGNVLTKKNVGKEIFCELFFNGISCGYAVPLNSADKIKTYSHMLSDTHHMLFDEYQSESNHYIPDEIKKFLSIHNSVSRGQGQAVRRVPVYMVSNTVSLLNPYFTALGLTDRLNSSARFVRGDGFVYENSFLPEIAQARASSGINRAFSHEKYVAYSSQNVYLNDSEAFIGKPKGRSKYLVTFQFNGEKFGVHVYENQNIVYCDRRVDETFKIIFAVNHEDHGTESILLNAAPFLLSYLREVFELGRFRFSDQLAKNCIFSALSF